MATFNDLQKKGKGLSDIISKKVAEKAPIKTGRLRKALRRANTFDSMIELEKGSSKQLDVKGFTINIDYAPTDAEYGMFWNEPTLAKNIKNGKTSNIPESINFAEKALADSVVQRALDEMVDVIGEMVAAAISKEIEDLDK